jgi:hypothetical protein
MIQQSRADATSPVSRLPSPTNGREPNAKRVQKLYWHRRAIRIVHLEIALARFGAALAAKTGIEQGAGG